MTEILRTASLTKIRDGQVAAQLDYELSKVFADCDERPNLKKARKITLEIEVTPSLVEGSTLVEVDTVFKVAPAKLPATEFGRSMRARKKNRGFSFEEDTDSTDPIPGQQRLTGIDDDAE